MTTLQARTHCDAARQVHALTEHGDQLAGTGKIREHAQERSDNGAVPDSPRQLPDPTILSRAPRLAAPTKPPRWESYQRTKASVGPTIYDSRHEPLLRVHRRHKDIGQHERYGSPSSADSNF